MNLCRLPRIEVRGYLSESATEAERLLEKMKDSKWLCWLYRVIWELHLTAVSSLHTSIKTNACRMHQNVCKWKVTSTDVEGPTETLTHETVVWFAHIECNGVVGMSLGDHVVRRKTSKSARNSTVICLEAPTGFEGNVMTLLVKWSDLFISGQLFTVLFAVGQF